MRHRRHRHNHESSGSPLWILAKYLLLLLVLVGVGGVTWIALTPLQAPTQTVVREVPGDKLGPL